MIYLDNAATTLPKPQAVIDAVAAAMESMGNAGRGVHGASLDASRLIYETREQLSELFGLGNPSRVAFTANSTQSLNTAIQGLLEPGDHAVTTVREHNSVLRPLYLMEGRGVELTVVTADGEGRIRCEDLERAFQENTRAVVVSHASNVTGDAVDIAGIGELCRDRGVLLIVDASQTAGLLPIHMKDMHIDVLCFTGHKSLLGPQGTGGICVREGVAVRPLSVGGSGVGSYSRTHPDQMPSALEAGTQNCHGIAGLHAALRYIDKIGADRIREMELRLMRRFYEGVGKIPGVKIYGDFTGALRAPIVSLNIWDCDSGEVADELVEVYGIYTRPGAHCSPLLHQALGTGRQGAVRFSMSHQNTEEEIDTAIRAVREIAKS